MRKTRNSFFPTGVWNKKQLWLETSIPEKPIPTSIRNRIRISYHHVSIRQIWKPFISGECFEQKADMSRNIYSRKAYSRLVFGTDFAYHIITWVCVKHENPYSRRMVGTKNRYESKHLFPKSVFPTSSPNRFRISYHHVSMRQTRKPLFPTSAWNNHNNNSNNNNNNNDINKNHNNNTHNDNNNNNLGPWWSASSSS